MCEYEYATNTSRYTRGLYEYCEMFTRLCSRILHESYIIRTIFFTSCKPRVGTVLPRETFVWTSCGPRVFLVCASCLPRVPRVLLVSHSLIAHVLRSSPMRCVRIPSAPVRANQEAVRVTRTTQSSAYFYGYISGL